MKLTVLERIVLMGILPKESDFTTLKLVRELQNKLSFTEKEHKLLQFQNAPNGNMTWNQDGNRIVGEVKIDIGDKMKSVIVDILQKLDKDKKITNDLYSLYEKFIET